MRVLIIKIFLSLCFVVHSQQLKAQVMGLEMLDGKDHLEIDFDYAQGFIILNIKFNNTLPLKFILDTGAEHIILFRKEITDILGLEYEKKINLIGSDLNREVYAYICRNVPIALENTPSLIRDIIVLEEDFLHLEELTGENIQGIIGSRMFRGLVMQLDYKKTKLHLYNAMNYPGPPDDDYKEVDITIQKHKPYINSTIINETGDSIQLSLLIDTGAALPFLIFLDTHPSLKIPDHYVKGNLGKGLGGDIEGYLSKVRKLQFTPHFEFKNIITSFQHIDTTIDPKIYLSRNGLLGNPILSRFDIILNLVNSKMYLKAHKNYNKEFKYDKSGMVIYAFGPELNNYYVKDVIEKSPAWNAGIRKGDMIKKIGIWPANFFSLGHILKKMKGRDGKKINVTMERNSVKYKTSFVLIDFLSKKESKKAEK